MVQKAIQATSVDARKQIAENIYVSGGVTMLPGFVERLTKEVAKLSKTKIVPKVRYSSFLCFILLLNFYLSHISGILLFLHTKSI